MITGRCPCPACQHILSVTNADVGGPICCGCGWADRIDGDAVSEGRIAACPFCRTKELYIQKDFPERIGVALVFTGVALATIFWYYRSALGAFGVLIAFFAVDWVLFHTRKDVTVCYRCLSQFRGMVENPDHKAFDLATNEKYRQERLRKLASRRNKAENQAGEGSG